MKINRLGALLILLVIIGGISSLYFLNKDKYSEESANYYQSDNQIQYGANSAMNSYNQYPNYAETRYEERIDSVDIYQNGVPGLYTVYTKQGFDVDTSTNKVLTYYYGKGTENESFDQYFLLDKRIEGNTVIQRIQNMHSDNIYNAPLFEFWILGDSVTAQNAISALINPINEDVKNSGGCVVVDEEYYEQGYQEESVNNIKTYYIKFDFDKITSSDFLNKLKDMTLENICGKYTYNNTGSNSTFASKNGILLFFPQDSFWNTYNIGGFISK